MHALDSPLSLSTMKRQCVFAIATVTQVISMYLLYCALSLPTNIIKWSLLPSRISYKTKFTVTVASQYIPINTPVISSTYSIRPIKVRRNDCKELFQGNETELKKAKSLPPGSISGITLSNMSDLINQTSNCWKYKRDRGYIMNELTEEEANFPIAFSFVLHFQVLQFEHLFKTVYRPQHIYCIHVDLKASDETFRGVEAILNCFPNAFLSSKRIGVRYPEASILQAQMICIEDLFGKKRDWKYFINLTGQEFPLKTNAEIVQILKALNGSNLVKGDTSGRFQHRFQKAGPVPHNLRPVKGMIYVAVTRGFVDFMLHDRRSHDLYNWSLYTERPEETFFATLNYNPSLRIPGSYKSVRKDESHGDTAVVRYVHWHGPCNGSWIVREVCVLGLNYLPSLANTPHLFANKFYLHRERVSLECLDELLYNRTMDGYMGRSKFNASWYSRLNFVVNKI